MFLLCRVIETVILVIVSQNDRNDEVRHQAALLARILALPDYGKLTSRETKTKTPLLSFELKPSLYILMYPKT